MKRLFAVAMAALFLLPGMAAAEAQHGGSTLGIGGVLVGACPSAGKWIDAETLAGDPRYAELNVSRGDAFRVFSMNGLEGEGKSTALVMEDPEPPMFDVMDAAGRKIGEATTWLSIRCPWDPMPRKAAALSPKNAAYQKAVEKYLAARGEAARPQIAQIFRVDLEGDGVDEVVISAMRLKNAQWSAADAPEHAGMIFRAEPGDYSLVLLRKIVAGKVREIPVCGFFAGKNKDGLPPTMHKVIGFADVDGDGVLEILTDSSYYEGYWYGVHAVQKDKVSEVLGNGFGV